MKLCERFTARNIDIEPSYDVVIFTGNYADVCANGVENGVLRKVCSYQ